MESTSTRLDWIQALRGIAAIMVVLVHTRFAFPPTPEANGVAEYIFYPMAMGVDLFFIISGFLMVLTTRNFDGSFSYAQTFIIKRIARIWPVYAFVSIMAIPIMHDGIAAFLNWGIVSQFAEGLLFIPHDPAHNHMYFSMAVDVAWTLCFEMYFYLVFTIAMAAGRYRYLAIAAWFVITLIAIPICMGGFSLNAAVQPSPIDNFRYANLALNPIIWDFVYGMAIAGIYMSPTRLPSSLIYGVMIVAVCILLMFWGDLRMNNFYGPTGWGAPLAVIFLAIAMLSKNGEIRVPTWSIWLGGISYSLYLIHIFVFHLADIAIVALHLSPDQTLTARIFIRPLLAVFSAYLVFSWVEKPLCSAMMKWLLRPQSASKRLVVESPIQSLVNDNRGGGKISADPLRASAD